MKIKPEQLAQHLKGEVRPVYLVTGDEPLLSEECCDQLRGYFRQQGFTERELLHVDGGFKWEYLLECASALSLFADRKIIELRLGSSKPGKPASDIIQHYLNAPPPDNVLLIVADKLDGASKKSTWVKTIEKQGVIVELWPVEINQLPGWIRQRAQKLGLRLDDDAVTLLSDRIEGNLLAARQELDKLALLYRDQAVGADEVIEAVSDSSRYDIYGLTEAALLGQPERCNKILHVLHQEGTEAAVVLWALVREVRALYNIQQGQISGQSFDNLCQREKIWGKRKPQLQRAIRRVPPNTAEQLLIRCADVDKMIKGAAPGDPWLSLSVITLTLAGVQLPVF